MKLLLFLCCVLPASAEVLHEDLRVNGCSDSDGEMMYTLDGEERWYADFNKKQGVQPLPPFISQAGYPGAYENAVAQQQVCRTNLKIARKGMKDPPPERDPPSSLIVYSRDDVDLDQPNTLICHVSGFYPAPVRVLWTRNGQNLTEGTSTNVPFPNKDGTFTQISRLAFVPRGGDVYSCSVEHPALPQRMTRIWDVEPPPPPPLGPAVFCGVGLTVGLLGVAAGTFFLIKGNECS
ncbi:LOW QUALITY PROTEIN: rano class II histocompatibility antigen, B alpha chain-like [Menidia menidia]